jgi:hypothetical protein
VFVGVLCCCSAWRQFVAMAQVSVQNRKLQLLITLQVYKFTLRASGNQHRFVDLLAESVNLIGLLSGV